VQPKSMEEFTGLARDSGTQVNYHTCPVCGDTRWKVYADPVNGKWFCFAHNGGGQAETSLQPETWAQDVLDQLAGKHARIEAIEWPECALPRWTPLCKRASKYLMSRGIDESLARSLGIVEMEDRLRVIIPFVGPTGRIIYWSARAYSTLEDGPKFLGAGGKHPLYVLPNWKPTDEIVVVEGALDAIAVHQHTGRHVVALGGKSLPLYLKPELLGLVRERIILMLDADALAAALTIKTRLPAHLHVDIVLLPDGEDPSSLGADIKELLA